MNKYDFTCPTCGDRNLEQRMTNVTVHTTITVDDKDRIQWGLSTNSGDVDVIGFMCGEGHMLELPSGPVVDEDDLITWFNHRTYTIEQAARQLGDVVIHGELIRCIADALEGQELVDLWNDIFPKNRIIYGDDNVYRRVKT